MVLKLRELKKGDMAVVDKITAMNELGRRIRDLGIIQGSEIQLIGEAPLYDPVAIKVGDTTLTLRNNEADYIFVIKKERP
jgi:ferrous iron transport protein A